MSDDPTASLIRITTARTDNDSDSNAPTISAARTGTEAALRALRNGLDQASTIAETIQDAVDAAGTAATLARLAASGGTYDPGSGEVDFLTGLDPATEANTIAAANTIETALTGANTTTFDFVSAAQYLADVAESYVPDALDGAATANAQATIAQDKAAADLQAKAVGEIHHLLVGVTGGQACPQRWIGLCEGHQLVELLHFVQKPLQLFLSHRRRCGCVR